MNLSKKKAEAFLKLSSSLESSSVVDLMEVPVPQSRDLLFLTASSDGVSIDGKVSVDNLRSSGTWADAEGCIGDAISDNTAMLQAIFDSHQGVSDLTLVLTPGKTYVTGSITWIGPKSLRIIGNGATIKQRDGNNAITINVRDADNVIISDCIFDGNQDHNTVQGAGAFLNIIGESVYGNTDSVRIEDCYFKKCRNQAITISHGEGKYIRFASIRNCRFHQCSSGSSNNAELTCQMRGPIRHAAITDCHFEECSLVDAGAVCGFSAEVGFADHWITTIVCANNTYYRSGTLVFVQKSRAVTISNLAADETGVSPDGSLFNVNALKLDDVGNGGHVVINNFISQTSATNTVSHLFAIEETGSVSDYVYVSNVRITGGIGSNISLTATNGGFRVINCACDRTLKLTGSTAKPSIAVNCVAALLYPNPDGPDYQTIFVACEGAAWGYSRGAKFINCVLSGFCDVHSPEILFEGCVSKADTGATIRIMKAAATNCTVRNCDFSGNRLYRAVECYVPGVIGLRVINNILEGTEELSGTILPVIDLNDAVSAYIIGNIINDNSGHSAIGRRNAANTLIGEITRNRGVKIMSHLPGPNASQLHVEENGYYDSGTWIALPEQFVY